MLICLRLLATSRLRYLTFRSRTVIGDLNQGVVYGIETEEDGGGGEGGVKLRSGAGYAGVNDGAGLETEARKLGEPAGHTGALGPRGTAVPDV